MVPGDLSESVDKRGLSAVMLAEQIGVTDETVWLMFHKIRQAMVKWNACYRLAGRVEIDDAFFGAPTEGGKRGVALRKPPSSLGCLYPRRASETGEEPHYSRC